MTLKPVFAAAVSALTCLSANAAADMSGYALRAAWPRRRDPDAAVCW